MPQNGIFGKGYAQRALGSLYELIIAHYWVGPDTCIRGERQLCVILVYREVKATVQ